MRVIMRATERDGRPFIRHYDPGRAGFRLTVLDPRRGSGPQRQDPVPLSGRYMPCECTRYSHCVVENKSHSCPFRAVAASPVNRRSPAGKETWGSGSQRETGGEQDAVPPIMRAEVTVR